jgi:hypothetical protein
VLAQASRLNFSTRLFNLIVTNIPGPQVPLYVLGRQLDDLYPVAFLPENHGLAIAIMSYNGGLDFGLLADYDALPDVDLIATGIDAALQELLAVAKGKPRPGPAPSPRAANTASRLAAAPNAGGHPAPIVPAEHARPKRGPAADMRAKRTRGSRPARKRSDT